MPKENEGSDGNHIPSHGPKGAGSKRSGSNPEWLVVNRAKKKWASVWRPIATNSMSLEASTSNPMYTSQLYKSVSFTEGGSVTDNAALQENPEVEDVAENESGAETDGGEFDGVEFTEDWSQKWISLENSL